MNKKQFISFICFCTLAISIIFATGQLFRDKSTTIAGYYSIPDNTVDAVIVGSSHVNSGYIPAVLWQEYGISAYNVYSWSQPVWISYHYIEEALKTQDIKLVVLDMYGMMYGNSHEQPVEIDKVNYRNSFSIDVGINRWKMMQTVADCGIDLKDPVEFINIIRYHTAWKNINKEMFTYNNHNDPDFFRGYGLQTNVDVIDAPEKMVDAQPKMPYDVAVKYLDKIVELSHKKGFELIFTVTPYQFYPSETEIFLWLENYAKEREIPFINYAANYADIDFDYATDMTDMSHLNYKGAIKITNYLGQFITDNYPEIVKKDRNNKVELDADAKKVYRVFSVNEMATSDYNNYFEYLSNDNEHVLFAAISGDSTYTQQFADACKKLGIILTSDGFTGVKDSQWKQFSEPLKMGDIELYADQSNAYLTVKGMDYHGDGKDVKFAIYDKVLERTTFYFYYDYNTDSIVIKDYPAKINGGIYD